MPNPIVTISSMLRSRRAVSAVEFALVLPLLLGLLFGVIDVATYLSVYAGLQRVASEVADVGAQFKHLRNSMTVSDGDEVGVLFLAAQRIGEPLLFPDASHGAITLAGGAAQPVERQRGGVIVTCVGNTGGGATVAWQAYDGATPASSRIGTAGGSAALPAGFTLRNGDSALFVEVFYRVRPFLLSGGWWGGDDSVTAYASAVFRPRLASLTTLDP